MPAWSFYGFGRVPEEQRQLIYFIFAGHHFEVLSYYYNIFEEIGRTCYSDHHPVLVRLKLNLSRP
ncbi:MAG: hypothetical protein N3G18_02835 [Candidatus Saccharicenans sp.]|nr:hypothetical protein [Candidatus Saccharicenans sp.]